MYAFSSWIKWVICYKCLTLDSARPKNCFSTRHRWIRYANAIVWRHQSRDAMKRCVCVLRRRFQNYFPRTRSKANVCTSSDSEHFRVLSLTILLPPSTLRRMHKMWYRVLFRSAHLWQMCGNTINHRVYDAIRPWPSHMCICSKTCFAELSLAPPSHRFSALEFCISVTGWGFWTLPN